MYCINCGVKLKDAEKACPLCKTVVFHPELIRQPAEKLYPSTMPAERVAAKALQSLATGIMLVAALIVFLCDYQINDSVTWSGYVIGSLGLVYVMLILPLWFRRPNPVIFTPCVFAAIGLFLLYINLKTEGNWFLSFAFPVTGGLCLIVTAVVTLTRYIRKGRLYIFGGASVLLGCFMILVEYLMNLTFHFPKFIGWSFYPLAILALVGGSLIYLAICRPARQTMERKFFI